MNMLVIGKKSLLALFVLGSAQLVAMKCDTLQKSKNELLVIKLRQKLASDRIEYRKRFYLKSQYLPHEELYKARNQLAFFEKNLLKLDNAIRIFGIKRVGATIAYNMQQKKVDKHKRFTV